MKILLTISRREKRKHSIQMQRQWISKLFWLDVERTFQPIPWPDRLQKEKEEKYDIINKQKGGNKRKNIAWKIQQKEEEGKKHKNTFNTIWLLLEAVKIRLSNRRRAFCAAAASGLEKVKGHGWRY